MIKLIPFLLTIIQLPIGVVVALTFGTNNLFMSLISILLSATICALVSQYFKQKLNDRK